MTVDMGSALRRALVIIVCVMKGFQATSALLMTAVVLITRVRMAAVLKYFLNIDVNVYQDSKVSLVKVRSIFARM